MESETDGGSSVQSWYGKSQHEEADGDRWERTYYGEVDENETGGAVEFVSEVEYRPETGESEEPTPADRSPRAVPASD